MSVIEKVAALLADHADMTDLSADDGCACGYPDPSSVTRHQAEVLAHAGLLRDDPENEETCPCGKEHLIENLVAYTSNGGPWTAVLNFDIPNLHALFITLTEADLAHLRAMLADTHPDRKHGKDTE